LKNQSRTVGRKRLQAHWHPQLWKAVYWIRDWLNEILEIMSREAQKHIGKLLAIAIIDVIKYLLRTLWK
jgi:hypothetical protein